MDDMQSISPSVGNADSVPVPIVAVASKEVVLAITDAVKDDPTKESVDTWDELGVVSNMSHDMADFSNDNEDSVTNCDSAMDAVEQWTQEQEDSNVDSNGDESQDGSDHDPAEASVQQSSIPLGAPALALEPMTIITVPKPTAISGELDQLRASLAQAQQEIEALETSTNMYRMQLKQAKELQRVRTMEVEAERTTSESALAVALACQVELRQMLAGAESTQAKYTVMIDEKERELKALKLENHEYPSRILKLQSEVDAEKAKFKSLADRFNSIKELELHRQKQKFMAVSAQQKEVFDRLVTKYNETVQANQGLMEQLRNMQTQVDGRDQQIMSAQGIIKQLRVDLTSERMRTQQLQGTVEQMRIDRDQTVASKEAAISDIQQKLQSVETEVRASQERDEKQSRMRCYFECPHENEPEIGDEIRLKHSDCDEIVSVEWLRATGSMPNFFHRIGSGKQVHRASSDDLGCILRATLINSAGMSVSADIGPVVLTAALAKQLHDTFLSKKETEFIVKSASASAQARAVLLTKDKIKIRDGKTTNVKEVYGPAVVVEFNQDDDQQFSLKLTATGPAVPLTALSPAARDQIALTIRAVNHFVSTKQPYKEKDCSTKFIQFLLLSLLPKDTTLKRENSVKLASRTSKAGLQQSFSQAKPPMSGHGELQPHPSSKPAGDLQSRHSMSSKQLTVPPSNDNAPSAASSRRAPSTSDIQYDAEGYIIRQDVGFDPSLEAKVDDDPNDPPTPSIAPIVIKPKSEAVEASTEALSRATLNFEKPPVASTSKPKPPPKEKKKKKGSKKPASGDAAASNDPAVDAPNSSDGLADAISPLPASVVARLITSKTASRRVVMAQVAETVSCNMTGGVVSDANVIGTVTLVVEPQSETDISVGMRLDNTAQMVEVMANAKAVQEISEYVYRTQIVANTASVPVLRYAVDIDADQFPIRVTTNHAISTNEVQLVIDVEGTAVDTISLLLGITPLGRVLSLTSATPPSCALDVEQQRICWKSVAVEPRFIANLRLAPSAPNDSPLNITPVLVQFARAAQLSNVAVIVDESGDYVRSDNQVSVVAKVFQAL